MILEYVVSGCGMFRLNSKDLSEESLNIINSFFSDNKDITILFNAFTEDREDYMERYNTKVYSDSGGLQIMTLNLDIDEVKKKHTDIYHTQASKSHIAMNFDEMPIVVTENSTNRDTKGRYFIHSKVEESARATADNIKRQIEVFSDIGTDTKIMMIGQGNDHHSYSKYLDTISSALTDYEREWIQGIAIANSACGVGSIQAHDMIYNIRYIDIPDSMKKHIHMLGFGAVSKLRPFLYSPDYFDFVELLSFDSTSRSRVYSINGMMLDDNRKLVQLPLQDYNIDDIIPYYDRVYKSMKVYFDKHPQWKGVEKWVMEDTYYSNKNKDRKWSYIRNRDFGTFSKVMVALSQVKDSLDMIKEEQNKEISIYKDIKTWDDYQRCRRQLISAYKLNSRPVTGFLDEVSLDRHQLKASLF